MMEQDAGKQERLPGGERLGTGTDERHLRRTENYGNCNFSEMESESGRGVHFAIDMMHAMKAPEKTKAMGEHVPDIQGIIQQHNSCEVASARRQLSTIDQSVAVLCS